MSHSNIEFRAIPPLDSGSLARAAALLVATVATLAWLDTMPQFALSLPGWLWLAAHASLVLTALVIARGMLQARAPAAVEDAGAGATDAPPAGTGLAPLGLAALHSLDDVVFSIDTEGCWAYLSPGWERLTGVPVAEALGRPSLQSLHQDDRARVQEQFENLRYDPSPCRCEARLRILGGRYAYVEIRVNRSATPGENASLHGSLLDVGTRWVAEEAVRQKRHLLNTLLNNLPGMAYRCRIARDWRMEYVSDGCFELTGYEAADLVGNRKLAYADLIHPSDRDLVWQECQAELKHRRMHHLEYRIVTRTGEVKWVWEQTRCVYSATGETLAQEGYISDITQHKLAEQDAHRQFIWDEVTGLHNAVVFGAWLEYALAQAHSHHFPVAVIALDLDDFGRWGRNNGREIGDRILEEVGRRLAAQVRGANIAARLKGDEFALLITDFSACRTPDTPADATPSDLAARLARQLQERIRRPMAFDGLAVQVTTSVGIAVNDGHAKGDAEAMLREASEACVRAKFLRSTQVAFADPLLDDKADGGRRVHTLLAGALGANALEISYRPVFCLATRRPVWWEPSLIWQHPRRGQLELMAGYPALQSYPNLFNVITRWMLREVIHDRRLLPDIAQGDEPGQRLCLALPCDCLEDRSVVEELFGNLAERGVPAEACVLLLGRPRVPQDPIAQRDALVGLRRAGFTLVADDTDAGADAATSALSSFCTLHRIGTERPHESLLRISRQGAAASIAVGIATEEALEMAVQAGCIYGSGPLLGEVRSAREVAEAWLQHAEPAIAGAGGVR